MINNLEPEKRTIEGQKLSDIYNIHMETFSRENFRMSQRLIVGVPKKNIWKVIKKLEIGYENHDRDISITPLCQEQSDGLKYYDNISGELYKQSNF